jgi:hypothetical protein
VTAVAVDPEGHVKVAGVVGGDAEGRITQVVDTATNRLFAECLGPWDVEDTYEAFWNRLNESWERGFPAGKERVKVLLVEPLDERCPECGGVAAHAAVCSQGRD